MLLSSVTAPAAWMPSYPTVLLLTLLPTRRLHRANAARMSQVSGRLGQLGSIEDDVALAINLGQGSGQRARHRLVRVEGGTGGPKDAGGKLGEQQRHPIALGRDAVALAVGHAAQQPLQSESSQVVGHLPG